jgi:hypothetical protein
VRHEVAGRIGLGQAPADDEFGHAGVMEWGGAGGNGGEISETRKIESSEWLRDR